MAEEIRNPGVNNETASSVAFLKEQVRYNNWQVGRSLTNMGLLCQVKPYT